MIIQIALLVVLIIFAWKILNALKMIWLEIRLLDLKEDHTTASPSSELQDEWDLAEMEKNDP